MCVRERQSKRGREKERKREKEGEGESERASEREGESERAREREEFSYMLSLGRQVRGRRLRGERTPDVHDWFRVQQDADPQ